MLTSSHLLYIIYLYFRELPHAHILDFRELPHAHILDFRELPHAHILDFRKLTTYSNFKFPKIGYILKFYFFFIDIKIPDFYAFSIRYIIYSIRYRINDQF